MACGQFWDTTHVSNSTEVASSIMKAELLEKGEYRLWTGDTKNLRRDWK